MEQQEVPKIEIDPSSEEMERFFKLMIGGVEGHYPLYGDSWRTMSKGKMYDRLKHKLTDFDLTYNPKKLVSLANLAMLLYFKLNETPVKNQNPMEMI